MASTASRVRFFAIRAAIAKRNAENEVATVQPIATRSRVAKTKQATRPAPERPSTQQRAPASIVSGTVSDMRRIEGPNGAYFRAQFQMKSGDGFDTTTAYISEATQAQIQDTLAKGYGRYYGVMNANSFRIIGLARVKRAPRVQLAEGPGADYSYQRGAYFGTTA